MPNGFRRELWPVLAWLIFPVVPVVLEDLYFRVSGLDFSSSHRIGPDPRVWGWLVWILMLGPLLGYGFLAGATIHVPDDDPPPLEAACARLLGRSRAVWEARRRVGEPFVCMGVFFSLMYAEQLFPNLLRRFPQIPPSWKDTWAYWAGTWVLLIAAVVIWAYSWLWQKGPHCGERSAWPARVARWCKGSSSPGRLWDYCSAVSRSQPPCGGYFFDPRIVRLLVVALGLTLMSGCIQHDHLRRSSTTRALPRDAGGLGPWPGAHVAVVESAPSLEIYRWPSG